MRIRDSPRPQVWRGEGRREKEVVAGVVAASGEMETEKGVVCVPRDALTEPLTCPLCHDLFREASAFSKCHHTFCRECIMKKIDDEEIDSCPICNVYLGIAPEVKLRPDKNIQSIRNKLFPLKTEADATKVPTITSQAKRKEKSLSSSLWLSLVTSSNQVEAKRLPQIPTRFIKIKDGSMQISSILSYITKKLELASDDKLEVLCNEWPICPSTTLHRLREHWLSRKPEQEVWAVVGGPAKDFVMELSYRRLPAAVSLCCMIKTKSVTTSLPCYCST